MNFTHSGDSHLHSLETLNLLYEYDDFMLSIRSVIDLGCGNGEDLTWWAARTTRDDSRMPLNIDCTGVDLIDPGSKFNAYPNIQYHAKDFEAEIPPYKKGYDILWCHDAFQFAIDPLKTLANWWHLASPGAMLYICVPVTQRVYRRQLDYFLPSGMFYHYTLPNLIYMLACSGWDCRSGFFKQKVQDDWLHVAVYRSETAPMDPKIASWYHLSEQNLLPESADKSIKSHGYLKQQDLVIPWLDRSLTSMMIY